MTGIDIICAGCILVKTEKCKNWRYWEDISAEYAAMCAACESKESMTVTAYQPKRLLRYPPGEAPRYRGVGRVSP
jgi:hypothetical protein